MAGLACIELSTTHPGRPLHAGHAGRRHLRGHRGRPAHAARDRLFALALIAVIGWVQGLRGAEFLVSMVVYASTIAVLTYICARTVGSMTGQINVTQALDSLNECFDDVGTRRGPADLGHLRRDLLPGAAPTWPASCRPTGSPSSPGPAPSSGSPSWPPGPTSPPTAATWPGSPRSRPPWPTTRSSSTPDYCVLPVGYASDGELVMVIERSQSDSTRRPPLGRVRRPPGLGLPAGHQPGQLHQRAPHREPHRPAHRAWPTGAA